MTFSNLSGKGVPMADDRPKMTPVPWPEWVQVNPAEYLPWFLEQTEEAQVWMLENWLDAMGRARVCDSDQHRDRLEELANQAADYRRQIGWLHKHRGISEVA
jgi:hypothetical protein